MPQVHDWHSHFADLASGKHIVRVITRLRRQVEGNRQTGLALFKIAAVQRIRCFRCGVTRIGPHHPWPVLVACHGFIVPCE